jgi:hypothetical protein
MGGGPNININMSLEEVDATLMDDFRGFKTSVEEVTAHGGLAITQEVSRRLPTAAARVQTRVWSCRIL